MDPAPPDVPGGQPPAGPPRTARSFAIIPAAGQSVRMGQPKLLMPWGETTIMEQVLRAWRASEVTRVVVVVRPDDAALRELCAQCAVEVVVPAVAPPEMRTSVQLGLEHVQQKFAPREADVWLLAPADMPGLSPPLINAVLAAHRAAAPTILVPTRASGRGHPVLFPWNLARQVGQLGEHEGVNVLLRRHPVRELSVGDLAAWDDVDTPEDYQRLRHPASPHPPGEKPG